MKERKRERESSVARQQPEREKSEERKVEREME
jgi:hypothetical protein